MNCGKIETISLYKVQQFSLYDKPSVLFISNFMGGKSYIWGFRLFRNSGTGGI
jgi:hypothetical protein